MNLNPWVDSFAEKSREVMRLMAWSGGFCIFVMALIFAICFFYKFFHYAWDWCDIHVFPDGGW